MLNQFETFTQEDRILIQEIYHQLLDHCYGSQADKEEIDSRIVPTPYTANEIYEQLLNECYQAEDDKENRDSHVNQSADIAPSYIPGYVAILPKPFLPVLSVKTPGPRAILPKPSPYHLTPEQIMDNCVLLEIERVTNSQSKLFPAKIYNALEISSEDFYRSRRRLTDKGYLNGEPWYTLTDHGKDYLKQLKNVFSKYNVNPKPWFNALKKSF